MGSLSTWLRVYCLLKVIAELNSYVLLAADAEDFRNIAKKIVPGTLANKLARLASDISVKQNSRDNSEDPEYYYESEAEESDGDTKEDSTTENNVRDLERSGEDIYVKEWKSRVNFDELVERVKDRLAKELSEKLKKHILNPRDKNRTQSIYNIEQRELQNDRLISSAVKDNSYGYPYNYNAFTTKKTYGYNIPKNKRQPNKNHKNINSYIKTASQESAPKLFSPQNAEEDYELHTNTKYINYEKNTKENYDNRITKNYDGSKNFFVTNAKHDKHIIKEKQSNEMNHKEDNNMFHSHTYKIAAYSIENRPKKKTNFNKKYTENDDDYIKIPEKDLHEDNESIKHDEVSSKQNRDQSVFSSTNNNKESFYDEFDLLSKRKNDSYEEYVIPKVENKYASAETSTPFYQDHLRKEKLSFHNNEKSRFKVQYNNNLQSTLKNNRDYTEKNAKLSEDYRDVSEKSQEIKAKTESLWYNYDDTGSQTIKDDRFMEKENISAIAATQKPKAKGTMIPTREYFKMSSPNYYISLPTVVEKYDSNEPLPEKDRERQIIKHFVNPPASVNKKVRLI